jgi:hypothetical protein
LQAQSTSGARLRRQDASVAQPPDP